MKKQIISYLFFHIVVTTSLLMIGEYSFTILLQFIYLSLVFQSKYLFCCVYFLSIHYALLLIFSSGVFILYFGLLFIIVVLIFKEDKPFKINQLFICMGVILLAVLGYIKLEEYIYDVYIWLDVVDDANYLNGEVILALSAIHVAILVWIIIKNQKKFIFKKD